MAVMALSLCAMSCDDSEADKISTSEMIEGAYNGVSIMSVMGTNQESDGVTTIKAQDDNHVTLVLPGAENNAKGMALPAITVQNVEITKNGDDSFALNVDTIDVTVGGMNLVSKGLTGTVKNNTLSLKYNIKPFAMPMFINFTFEGKR